MDRGLTVAVEGFVDVISAALRSAARGTTVEAGAAVPTSDEQGDR